MDHIFETIGQSWFWQYFFSHFGWVDWVLSVFLVLGLILGLKHGVSQEIPRLVEILISLYVSFEFHSFFTEWLTRETPLPESYARPLTFALLSFLSWLALRLLFEILGKLVQLQVATPFQIVGGLLVGPVRFFLIFGLVSCALILLPLDWIHRSYQVQSWSGQALTQVPPQIHDWIKGVVVRKVQA